MDKPIASETGLAAAFETHRNELLRFIAARWGDGSEAEDLLQDLWLKLRSVAEGPVANPRAYLFRMANNLVLDRRRAQQRAMRRDRSWLEAGGADDTSVDDRPDPAPLADALLEEQQEQEALQAAIADLPPGARRALVLYRFDGHGQAEIAAIMGISRSGVEKHLALAMRHLRDALADCGKSRLAASGEHGDADGQVPQPGMER